MMTRRAAQENPPPAAVLVGLDSLQGVQSARILARRGVPVIALARDRDHYCCRTNVCQEIIYTDTESETLIETLVTVGERLPTKAVLFPCEDANVLLVARHRARLEAAYHIMLPATATVETLLDKANFYAYAQQQGLPIPRTWSIDSRSTLEATVAAMRFPVILKPPLSAAPAWEHSTYQKAFKVQSAAELRTLYEQCRHWSTALLVQEWIEGPESNHYTCNCYFDADGNVLTSFTTQKIRQWPPRTGQACLGVECDNGAVRAATIALFAQINYRGLAYLEMKQESRTGEYLIIEPNIGRPTGRSATAEAAGVELLYTMYCDALGLPLPAAREQQFTNIKWIFWRQDFQSALHYWRRGELTLGEWWRSWQGRKVSALWDWRDPRPFLADLWRVARVALSAKERQRRNYNAPILAQSETAERSS